MGIDGSKGEDFLNRGIDDGNKPAKQDCVELGSREDMFTNSNWKVGRVSSGGKWHKWNNGPPRGDFGTKPVEAASPSGKYAKKGGSSQRSGS